MPTCSQAKIITNLETEINKRLFKLSVPNINENGTLNCLQNGELYLNDNNSNSECDLAKYNNYTIQNNNINNNSNNDNEQTTTTKLIPITRKYSKTDNYLPKPILNLQNYYSTNGKQYLQRRNSKTLADFLPSSNKININQIQAQQQTQKYSLKPKNGKSRRISVDDLPIANFEAHVVNKIPIIFNDFVTKKDSVPVNFLYNSPYRQNRNSLTLNQIKINSLRSTLNIKTASDGEDDEEDVSTSGGVSDENNSEKSTFSLPENIRRKSQTLEKPKVPIRKSIDNGQLHFKLVDEENKKDTEIAADKTFTSHQRNNSIFLNAPSAKSDKEQETLRKASSISHNNLSVLFANFPRIALEVDSIEQNENLTTNDLNNADVDASNNKPGNLNTSNINNSNNIEFSSHAHNLDVRRVSVNQAKRLLALASIRPSKTFHKTMTEEEIEILKKYYELIRPKVNAHITTNTNDSEDEKYKGVYTPLVYDMGKVNFESMQNLKNFLDAYKKDIQSGVYQIEYDQNPNTSGFVLKSPNSDSVVRFPNDLNDTFFAVALTSSDKENTRLGEANLFRVINWNDIGRVTNKKRPSINSIGSIGKLSSKFSLISQNTIGNFSDKNNQQNNDKNTTPINKTISSSTNVEASTTTNEQQQQQQSESSKIQSSSSSSSKSNNLNNDNNSEVINPKFSLLTSSSSSSSSSSSAESPSASTSSSVLNFEYIKNLTSLVNSIIEPKLLKQLTYSGVDVSTLPGGPNFEMPTFEELGINLENLLSDNNNSNSNNNNGTTNNAEASSSNTEEKSTKLKSTAYKKLKERVSNSKVMWFNGPPERRPLAIVFELPGFDIGHEIILKETNNYLKDIGGCITSIEFVPRSVHLGSVYVENQWILTLNDMNTKYHALTHGIQIKEQKITVKSYDEFMFAEYEKFIRNEKYKQLIKNHERAVQNSSNKKSKKN